jgi:hypothetical protein
MATDIIYRPKYENSWALIIGINRYEYAPPLAYARNDAEAVAAVLKTTLGFPSSNVKLLLDDDATRDSITSVFLSYAQTPVSENDRLVVFFAGHGHTRLGRRGEIGYLVPVDGDPGDLATLVRWDDLTKNSELIPAKHILFVMDACYGGLALTRGIPAGSMRFLKDMLRRYSRQVLTAGKADEVVADSGGPRPQHSVFTGHLLDALEGAAASPDGVLSTNAVMAYVYEKVTRDHNSHQSPHYGFLDGDGDLIFDAPNLSDLDVSEEVGQDLLIPSSPATDTEVGKTGLNSLVDTIKEYLAEPRYRIRLDDLVASEVRAALYEARMEEFPVNAPQVDPEEFASRLRRYEQSIDRLLTVVVLLARWGTEDHRPVIERLMSRLADGTASGGGLTVWLGLSWYPITCMMYAGGVAALSANNYANLAALLITRVGASRTGQRSQEIIIPAIQGILAIERGNLFKTLPGHERHYVPKSEYLFRAIQPRLEDMLFLGRSYEELFDRFEVMYALVCADTMLRESNGFWGPPGRFGWKHRDELSIKPFDMLVTEAQRQRGEWLPIIAGFFGGDYARFEEVALRYRTELLDKLGWS